MVGVFGAEMAVYFSSWDWDKSWKFWTIMDSLEWVWGLPLDGLDHVYVIAWAVLRWTAGLLIGPRELILCYCFK